MDTDVEQPHSATSNVDMASSLRAAALLSRKRRRVDPGASALPPRLAQQPTLQLDYANDIPAPRSDPKLSPVLHPTAPEPTEHMEDVEDGQIREEGEISDTEASPPPPRSPTPPPRLRQRPFTSQPLESTKVEPPPSRIEAPTTSPSEPSDARAWQPASTSPESFMLETSTYRLDANHVRPGLSMTQDQYNTAKDIVLDLLGWGVPPEYLLECGLSRHAVFYVFSELNLRLPSNLDTSGLIPYPTPEMLALIPVSPSLSARSLHPSPSTMPPPSVIPARVSLAERMSVERVDTRMPSPEPSPFIKTEPSSPSSVDLSNSHSLLAIEQQRRQELLARKAAIASRRVRQDFLGFSTPSKDQDIDMSAVPAQSVDDFLKTIEPAPHLDTGDNDNDNRGSFVGTTSFSSLERTDVDDLIPGLNGASRDTSTSSAGPSSSRYKSCSSTTIYTDLDSPVSLPTGSADNAGSTSNGTERGSATSVDMAVTGSGSPTPTHQGNQSYAILDGDSGYPQRRGMKRPVAADFVDFDSGPGPSRGHGSSSSNGYSNGGPYANPLSKRKAGSFAGIGGMRRCVIELSDSEDDGDSQARGDHVGNSDTREYSPGVTTAFTARVPSRLTSTPTMPSSLVSSSVTNGNTGQPFPTATTTNALAEKEEEIKRMRRLIAQREELRSKKLAAMSGKSTPVIPSTLEVEAQGGTVTVKQEETLNDSLSRKNSSTILPLRDWESNHTSIPELTRRHGLSVVVADGKSDVLTYNSATVRTPGTSGPAGDSNDLPTQETSTIGHELSVQDGDSEDEQDLMITGETQSAQVVPSSKEDTHQESLAAGDSGTSSSAQVLRPQLPQSRNEAAPELSRSGFPLYDSPLSRYPLLRPRFGPDPSSGVTSFVKLQSGITTASQAGARITCPPSVDFPSPVSCTTSAVSSHSSSPIPLPDLKQLKEVVLLRSLAQLIRCSPDLRVCQYEVPGGGVCRDKDCGELHLSQISREPSDTEVAAYVHGMLPRPWNGRCNARAIEIALEGVRLRRGATDVDSRVREALGGLGIPMN